LGRNTSVGDSLVGDASAWGPVAVDAFVGDSLVGEGASYLSCHKRAEDL